MIRHWIRAAAATAILVFGGAGCGMVMRVPTTPPFPQSALPAIQNGKLSKKDAIADLDTFMRTLENVHPDPYAFRSRTAVYADRERLISDLPEYMTPAEWWIRLSVLVASLADGHTSLAFPIEAVASALADDMQNAATDQERLERLPIFPINIELDDAQHLIVKTVEASDTGIRRGDRILSINGRDAHELLTEWADELSGDSAAGRMAEAALMFRRMLLLHSIPEPYTLGVASEGRERTVILPRRSSPESNPDRDSYAASSADAKLFEFQVLDHGIGYMDFQSMDGDYYERFKKDLAVMFREIATRSIRTLIIDLRKNGGGDDALAQELLRYITEKPYRTWARGEFKRSAELRAYNKSYYRRPFRWLPWKYVFAEDRMIQGGPKGSIAPYTDEPIHQGKRAEPFFAGPVCVLTGPRTFSAAVVFADAIRTYRLATLVGEETGGHPNFFSEGYEFRLPRSGFLAKVSTARWVRANEDTADFNGVIPDIVVKTSAEDIRTGRDPVIERALSCPAID